MIDLSTQYLGLKLANPLVPSASPLSKDISTAKQLEDAGFSSEEIIPETRQTIYERSFRVSGQGNCRKT